MYILSHFNNFRQKKPKFIKKHIIMNLNEEYWGKRYLTNDTGWDAKSPTAPLQHYIDQLKNKALRVLIPGCGNAYEAEYMFNKGFKNVFVTDIASVPLNNFKERCPSFPSSQLIHSDFFNLEQNYDLILEQTFFCALDPSLRKKYAEKCAALLVKGGKLAGVLFDDKLNNDKPPFGGSKEEYISYFRPYFDIKYFDKCTNSIPPRAGRELFINLIKR
jgi:methyl halide transferase